MTEGAEYTLKDSRDETPYYIAKLADGNVWMTQNLDFDIEAKTYTPDDTDIPANWTVSSSYATKTTTSWNWSYTSPESYNPGDLYWSGTTGDSTTSSTGNKHYHLGNYYNWSAAVAMDNTSAYGASSLGAPNLPDQSICPAGWTLPRAGTGSDTFYSMLNNYGLASSTTSGSYSARTAPLYFALSGYWYGSLSSVGSDGRYWSAVSFSPDYAYPLYFYSPSSYYDPLDQYNRENGYSVRCVARPLTTSLTDADGGHISGGGNN